MTVQTKNAYQDELSKLEREIDTAKRLDKVNNQLHSYNSIFLHPYSQGMDIGILQRIINDNENPEYEIFKFFAKKFLNLSNTIDFIEGFFPTRPYIKDYIIPIKESVVLCLQKDFRGAICILIPVIEGVLRKYLIAKMGENKKSVTKIDELLKSIDKLIDDYIELQKEFLKNRYDNLIKSGNYFDCNQEKQILKKHKEYFTIWTNQFKNYMTNKLYMDTTNNDVTDMFNRHVIFHFLDENIEFSFANYLRLYNSLIYLSWTIGLTNKNCSILSEADETLVKREFANYLNVLFVSEAMTKIKNEIYKTNIDSFRDFLSPEYIKILDKPERLIKKGLTMTDFLKQ